MGWVSIRIYAGWKSDGVTIPPGKRCLTKRMAGVLLHLGKEMSGHQCGPIPLGLSSRDANVDRLYLLRYGFCPQENSCSIAVEE